MFYVRLRVVRKTTNRVKASKCAWRSWRRFDGAPAHAELKVSASATRAAPLLVRSTRVCDHRFSQHPTFKSNLASPLSLPGSFDLPCSTTRPFESHGIYRSFRPNASDVYLCPKQAGHRQLALRFKRRVEHGLVRAHPKTAWVFRLGRR